MDLALRQATPADAQGAAQAADTAAGGVFTAMLGKKADEIVAMASRQPGHTLSLEHVIVAELNGRPVGWMSAMPGPQASDSGNELARAAGIRAVRMMVVYLAGYPVFHAMDQHEAEDYHVQSIAVSEQARGQGVGTRLLARAESDARQAGAHALTLDVDTSNSGAERLYRSLGFAEVRTSGKAYFLDGVSVRRLSKPLQ